MALKQPTFNSGQVITPELKISDLPIRLYLAYQDLDRIQAAMAHAPELWSDLLSAMCKVSRLERALFRPGPELVDALRYLGLPTYMPNTSLDFWRNARASRVLYEWLWRWHHEQRRIWRMKAFGLFQYRPLKQASDIRLVEIRKGRLSDLLECDLKYVSSNDKPVYEALSYTWGSADTPHEVACGEGYLQITQNLKNALLQLRHPAENRRMWIDAISINQRDENERNHQVKLMKQIFQQAAKVIIFLGDWRPDDSCENRIRNPVTPKFAHRFLVRRDNDKLLRERLQNNEDRPYSRPWGISPFEDGRLFARQWFHRAWIVQEVASARSIDVLIGSFRTTWTCLVQMARHFTAVRDGGGRNATIEYYGYGRSLGFDGGYKAAQHVLDVDDIRSSVQTGPLPPLRRLLEPMFFTQCTDPRDKVYALVNLTSDAQFLLEGAEYSLPVSEVFTRLVQFAIEIYNSLEILYFAGGERGGLPSWVPNFAAKKSGSALPWPAFRTMSQDRAEHRDERPVATFRSMCRRAPGLALEYRGHLTTMSVEGTVIGVVSSIGALLDLPDTQNGATTLDQIYEDWRILRRQSRPAPTPKSLSSRCDELPQVGRSPDAEVIPHLVVWLDECAGSPSLSSKEYLQFVLKDTFVAAKRYREYLASQCRPLLAGRRLAVATSGHMVCAPARTGLWDYICLLRGADVPFVLRPLHENTYKLIGACYIENLRGGHWTLNGACAEEFLLQ